MMHRSLHLFDQNRRNGSYLRRDLKGDVLYSSYHHRDISLYFGALGGGVTRVEDQLTADMLRAGFISPAQKTVCDAHIQSAFADRDLIESFDDASVEEIYQHIHSLRREVLGGEVISRYRQQLSPAAEDYIIDQRTLKDVLLQRAGCIIFALHDAAWLPQIRADMARAQRLHKKLFLLCSAQEGEEFPTQAFFAGLDAVCLTADAQGIAFHDDLQQHVDRGEACLLAYGEEALLRCRKMKIDAFIHARPTGFFARALINTLESERSCAVYVPAHWDITAYVPLRERARLTYWQLYQLQKDFGSDIYACAAEEMYRRWPQYFINMYQNGACCAEAAADHPLRMALSGEGDIFAQHDLAREAAVAAHLNSFSNLTFSAHYFDENFIPAPLPYTKDTSPSGILVHALRVKSARNAGILSRAEDQTLRRMFTVGQTGVFSNFLFFMTPKLAALYNDLRQDRPQETADVTAGHLDYKLCYEDGKRVETFPLFSKMCMAMKEDGTFLFFIFNLSGGRIRAGEWEFSWQKEHVNAFCDAPVCVYTPALSCEDADADRQTYRRTVGEGRVNLVILQDRIHCIRRGDVILPSVGVVVSLREDAVQPLLSSLKPLENGYYDASALDYTAELDAPQGIDPAVWRTVRWAYGGGLTLIRDGQALSDSDDMIAWFEREGWMSPLSRQTQESALHTLSRHPRTAIGQAENGDMLLFVFSGRTSLSVGADYVEMCRIARLIHPDVTQLMNVDGGASAVMCMVNDGTMLELNCPSTSSASCAGMARPIKTLLYIPAE